MIKYIQIIGERNSGTNYLQNLSELNLKNVEIGQKYGWKHGFFSQQKIDSIDTSHVLFLCLFKDPYSWIVSMFQKPHHAPQLYGLPFSTFIRSIWTSYSELNFKKRAERLIEHPMKPNEELLHDRNPQSGKKFQNLIALRNSKNRNFLRLKELVPNYKMILYEDLLKNPAHVLHLLATSFDLQENGAFQDLKTYYGKKNTEKFDRHIYYQKKLYLSQYSDDDLEYVNMHVNWELETQLGYSKISKLVNYTFL